MTLLSSILNLAILKIVLISYLSITFIVPVSAAQFCNDLMSDKLVNTSEVDVLHSLEVLESKVQDAYLEANNKVGSDARVNKAINMLLSRLSEVTTRIEDMQDRALSDVVIKEGELNTEFERIDSIRLEIQDVKNKVINEKSKPSEKSYEETWTEVESNVNLIEAEVIYKVPANDGVLSFNVSFSKKLVKEVFQTNDPALLKASSKALKQIRKGLTGGRNSGGGFKKLSYDKKLIFELGAVGKDAGNLRFGGYLKDRVYHFVHWAKYGEHGSDHYMLNFIKSIERSKIIRGDHEL